MAAATTALTSLLACACLPSLSLSLSKPSEPYHAFEELSFSPRVAVPSNFTLLNSSSDSLSSLFAIELPSDARYHDEPALLAVLQGTPSAVGRSYAELLGTKVEFLYKTWLGMKIPNELERDVVGLLLDWLWAEGLDAFTPSEFREELQGMKSAAGSSGVQDVDKKAIRLVTLSNLPADTQNIERVVFDLVVNGPNKGAGDRLRDILKLVPSDNNNDNNDNNNNNNDSNNDNNNDNNDNMQQQQQQQATMDQGGDESFAGALLTDQDVARLAAQKLSPKQHKGRTHGPGMCDYFAVWGNQTEDGRLLSSRNLDFDRDIDISTGKLLTVVRYSGDDAVPYFTAGIPGYWGALAGASAAGITVSEANLDNSDVSFRSIAWPIRLRQILNSASNLADAKKIWDAAPNSGAFNFLLASAIDVNATVDGQDSAVTQAAMALETTFKHTSAFTGNDPVEDSATFRCDCEIDDSTTPPTCVNGTVLDGVPCNWPFSNDTVSIGSSIPNAVFRSNHGLHPATMATQEPLWNDTVKRYFMLHDAISELASRGDGISALGAVNITAYLGIKGSNYTSCDAQYYPSPTQNNGNTMSVTYDPSKYTAYVAWEDGTIKGGDWRPAACNTYIQMDFQKWFYPY